jgi:hypothetical protein
MRKTKKRVLTSKKVDKRTKAYRDGVKSALDYGKKIHDAILGGKSPSVLTSSPQQVSPDQQEEVIVITISKSRAQRISHNLSDILCWADGFKAGVRTLDEYSNHLGPFNNGITSIRDIQDLIKYKL